MKTYTLTEEQAFELGALITEKVEKVAGDLSQPLSVRLFYLGLLKSLGAEEVAEEIKAESGIDYDNEKDEDPLNINQGLEPRTLRRGLDSEGSPTYF